MPRAPATSLVDCTDVETRGIGATQIARINAADGSPMSVRVRRLPIAGGIGPGAEARFLSTCALAEVVRADNVDRILAFDGAPEPYVATANATGVTLEEVTDRARGGLEPAVVAVVGEDIARGLVACHALTPPLVHGALDLTAVVVRPDGRAQLTDFGIGALAHELGRAKEATAEYRAPEQLGKKPPTDHSDVFSLGALLYELITGVAAFEGSDAHTSSELASAVRYEPIDAVRPSTPRPLIDLVHQMLSAKPDDRPTATQIAGSLSMLAGEDFTDARQQVARYAAQAAAADVRRTAVHGPDLAQYARALFEEAERKAASRPPPGAPPPAMATPGAPAPAAAPPPAVSPAWSTDPDAMTPEARGVPRTVVMAGYPEPREDRVTAPVPAPVNPRPSPAGGVPIASSSSSGGYPTAPSPSSSNVPVVSRAAPQRSGVPGWLIWVGVAFGAFAFLGIFVVLAILIAS